MYTEHQRNYRNLDAQEHVFGCKKEVQTVKVLVFGGIAIKITI